VVYLFCVPEQQIFFFMKFQLVLLMALAVSYTSFLSGQQTVSLLKNHSEEGLLPPELNAQRHRTAEIQTDLLSLAKSSTLKLDLFEDISYNVKLERLDRKHVVGDVDVYWGNSGDPAWAHLPHYNDVILTVNRSNGKAIVYAMTSDGMFVVTPTMEKNRYLIYQATDVDWEAAGCANLSKTIALGFADKQVMMSGCEEQDTNGNYVVDMFFSYSHEAELALGDVVAHSIAQAETVNVGLANSLVTNTYLRDVK
jgi:hypothetical protein